MSRAQFRALLISSVAVLPLLAAPAQADAPLSTPIAAERDYSATLEAASGDRAVRTLDWRTPAVELRFDLSQADIIGDLSVTLSADPLPGADPDTPLLVQFNNGRPVPIETRGEGFDATVTLDPARARASSNVLRLSYGQNCTASQGGYAVHLDRSRIDLSARPKQRRLQLREVERRLGASAFAPETVGLIATGTDEATLRGLGAQAIGLRMDTLPDFRTGLDGTDFNLIMVTRAELSAYTDEDDILSARGAAIALSRAHPNRLFLTGDTPAEVRRSVEAFSRFYLPQSRRSLTTPGELTVQAPLDFDRVRIDGTARLDALSVQTGALREYVFDVSDPEATQGELVLRLARDRQTAPGARVKAVLNGVSLGEAELQSRRKTVAFPIRPGLLTGSGNRLELTTKAGPTPPACGEPEPFVSLGAGSRLNLSAGRASVPSDLSLLAANGSVFAHGDGAETAVVLPEGEADYEAALTVLARLAQAGGISWTQADFTRGDARRTDRHVLVIEPYSDIEESYRGRAPRGLTSAWNGQPVQGDNQLAAIERFAGLDAEEAVRMASRRARADGRIEAGGVAALYPAGNGRLIGIISNTPGQSFAQAMTPLSGPAHWNGLTGGVTRWNDRAVVMAQAALPAPGLRAAHPVEDPSGGGLGRLGIDLPDIDWPRINLVDPTDIGVWIQDRWDAVSSRNDEPEATPIAPASEPIPMPDPDQRIRVAQPDGPLPRLKPAPVPAGVQIAGLERTASPAPDAGEAPILRGLSETHTHARPAAPARRGLSGLKSWIAQIDANTQGLRAELRRTLGIPRPQLKSLRIGSLEIGPVFLMMILTAIFALASLIVMAPKRITGGN